MKKLLLLTIAATTLVATGCNKKGCTDPVAINYDADAEKDDESCEYDGNVVSAELTEDITSKTTILAGVTEVCGTIDISAEAIISPGATLVMCPGAAINVTSTGSLTAVGTDEDPIIIEGETNSPGFWSGIAIRSNNPANQFDYVTVQDGGSYWGYEYAVLFVGDGAQLAITNSTVSNGEDNGMFVTDGGSISDFGNNTFSNSITGLTVTPRNVPTLDEASDYVTGNDNAYIHVLAGDVNVDATWGQLSAPLLLHGIDISAGLTLEPGVHIQVESADGIDVESTGYLNAEGTASNPIIIEGRVDAVAYWAGLQFGSNNPNNVLNHVTVSNGGTYWGYEYSNIQVYNGSLTIDNCTVTDGNSWGLFVNDGSILTSGGSTTTDPATVMANNTFSNNGTGPDADCTAGCAVYFEP